jgi:hypothetical protein
LGNVRQLGRGRTVQGPGHFVVCILGAQRRCQQWQKHQDQQAGAVCFHEDELVRVAVREIPSETAAVVYYCLPDVVKLFALDRIRRTSSGK